MSMRHWALALPLLLVAGCAAATPSVPVATDAGIVTVTLTDFAFTLNPSALTAGSYRFRTVNAGHTAHVVVLDGPGVKEQRTAMMQPGEYTELAATLQAGRYDLYCPVDGHRDKGMETHIDVGAASTPAPSSGGTGGY
jgi:plastocyanin